MHKQALTNLIKEKAIKLGFHSVGITAPKILEKETNALQQIIQNNKHVSLSYLEKYIAERKDINLFFSQAKSVIITLSSYYPEVLQTKSNFKISYYAYSNDYHYTIKSKLIELLEYIKELYPKVESKIFCDTAPVFEKAYAASAGLGWIGKNTLLINSQLGSYVFIGGIVTNVDLVEDKPLLNSCPASCNLCIKACPVNAIEKPYILNPSKCISYATIEQRSINMPFNNPTKYIAGCDICQQVCPFNKEQKATNKWFTPNEYVFWETDKWETLTSSQFNRVFNKTIFKRIGYKKLKRNIESVV